MDSEELKTMMETENRASETRMLEKFTDMVSVMNENLLKKIAEQDTKIKSLEEENRRLAWRVNDMEQYDRRANVQINNVPQNGNEDIGKMLCEMGTKIGVPIDFKLDVQAAHRIPSMNPNSKPIVVRFTNRMKRDAFLVAARNKKLTASDLPSVRQPGVFVNTKIYVNDHLSPDNRKLFYEAKKAVREKKLKTVRFRNGKVCVQRDDMSQLQPIHDLEELKPFL